MTTSYQLGQRDATNGKAGGPPRNMTPAEKAQYRQGYRDQQQKQGNKN